jgi:hypothetical protein
MLAQGLTDFWSQTVHDVEYSGWDPRLERQLAETCRG